MVRSGLNPSQWLGLTFTFAYPSRRGATLYRQQGNSRDCGQVAFENVANSLAGQRSGANHKQRPLRPTVSCLVISECLPQLAINFPLNTIPVVLFKSTSRV